MLNPKTLLVSFSLLCGAVLFAKDRTINGKIVGNKDKTGIVGATVYVKGTTIATSTSQDGSFSLKVPQGKVTLEISSIGYVTQERVVDAGQNDLVIDLTEGAQQLGEVVVTALGVTKNKRNLNYATQTVDTKDITKARETNVANNLSG